MHPSAPGELQRGAERSRRVGALLAALALGAAPGCSGPEPAGEPDNGQPGLAAVGRIEVEHCGANAETVAVAAAVGPNHVVTVAHAFDDPASLTVFDASGSKVAADLTYLDAERDVALIELDEATDVWFELGTGVAGGQASVLVRNPDDSASSIPTVIDRVVDVSIDGVGLRAGLELDAGLDPGRSGAPVVDDGDAMVGMVFAADSRATRAWAVAASEIEAALEQQLSSGPILLDC